MLNWSFNRSLVTADASDPGGPSMNDMSHIPAPAPPRKPKIALALGGGAARGWAHIGVLRALDEEGIDIGMIAGTSIGALVGGCYLAGKLDELEARKDGANNNLAGAIYMQSLSAQMQAEATMCDVRTREALARRQAMEAELRALQDAR